jgi:hypothetical protein
MFENWESNPRPDVQTPVLSKSKVETSDPSGQSWKTTDCEWTYFLRPINVKNYLLVVKMKQQNVRELGIEPAT